MHLQGFFIILVPALGLFLNLRKHEPVITTFHRLYPLINLVLYESAASVKERHDFLTSSIETITMINEQINLALTELLRMNFGLADLNSLFSFTNHSNDKVYRYEYSLNDASNKQLRNLISTTISDQAIKNDCVVFHQANSIRIEKKIYNR